jgi:rod shape determining protein RodA
MNLQKFSPRSFDWPLLGAVMLMMIIGFLAVYSIDLSVGDRLVYIPKQLLAAGIGLVMIFFLSLTQYTFFRTVAKAFYVIALALLAMVLVLGYMGIKGVCVNTTCGWIPFPGGFSFQPVEFAKVALVLMLAYITAHFGRRFERPLFFIGTGMVTLIPMFLIMEQPDLGGALVLGMIWFGMMCLAGVRKLFLIILVLAVGAVSVLGWNFFLKDYQRNRFKSFLNQNEITASTYNIRQALIAIGSGGLWGKGIGQGSQSQLRFLPEAQTDFIFSVIAEELGFIGASALIILFGVVEWRLVRIMREASDDFIAVTVGGIAITFFIQFFVNVGAEVGLLPLTGITVPFVSYGGSSLIINLMMIGIVQSMIVKKY